MAIMAKKQQASPNQRANKVKRVLAPSSFQKQMQEIAALHALAAVYTTDQAKSDVLNMKLFNGYMKSDACSVKQLLAGEGEFGSLWEANGLVNPIFPGHFVSKPKLRLSKRNFTFRSLISTTLDGKSILEPKGIMNKANTALRNCKKYLALWNSFLILGNPPSGKTLDDILRSVIASLYKASNKVQNETGNEGVKVHANTGQDTQTELPPTTSNNTLDDAAAADDEIAELEDDDEIGDLEFEDSEDDTEDNGQEDEDSEDNVPDNDDDSYHGARRLRQLAENMEDDDYFPQDFAPSSIWAFILFGPYAQIWGRSPLDLLSINPEEQKPKTNGGRAKKRQIAEDDRDKDRDSQPERGYSDLQHSKLLQNDLKLTLSVHESETNRITNIRNGYSEQFQMMQMLKQDYGHQANEKEYNNIHQKQVDCLFSFTEKQKELENLHTFGLSGTHQKLIQSGLLFRTNNKGGNNNETIKVYSDCDEVVLIPDPSKKKQS